MRILKKFVKVVVMPALIVVLSLVMFTPFTNVVKGAEDEQVISTITQELKSFIEYGEEEESKQRQQRVAGSEAEYKSAIYIKSILDGLVSFIPVSNGSTEQGVSQFNFTSSKSGDLKSSQTLVYRKEGRVETDKKVVLACHYDSAQVLEAKQGDEGQVEFVSLVTEGVSDNAGSVATLIALAKAIDSVSLDFDIEIVFFGAGNENYAGAEFYLRGLSDKECKNILLMLNLDNIGVGAYNYYYVNEYQTPQDELYTKVLGQNFAIKRLQSKNVINVNAQGPNGLDYVHIGLESDHACFMDRDINVLNFFSGDYENLLTYGLNEYSGVANITYTKNDTYDYITSNCSNYFDNLKNVYSGVLSLLSQEGFLATMEKQNNSQDFYAFWTNEKVAVFVTAILLFVFIFLFYIIYYILNKKSRRFAEQSNIDGIVLKITSNIGREDQVLNDAIDKKIKEDLDEKDDEE